MTHPEYLNRLYAAVQIMAPDNRDADDLFRETFDGSFSDPGLVDDDATKMSFYGKLVSILRQNVSSEDSTIHSRQTALKSRVAEQFVSRVFAPAFLQLKPGEQLLLFLNVVEGLDPDSIAEITGFESDHAAKQLLTVRNKLKSILGDYLGPFYQQMPQADALPDDWIDRNIRSFVNDHLSLPDSGIHVFVESRMSPGFQPPAPPPRALADKSTGARSPRRSSPATRFSLAVVIVLCTGLLGFYVSRLLVDIPTGPVDVIELSIAKAAHARPVLGTDDADQAERFIRSHFNRVMAAPNLNGAVLKGVGSTEIVKGRRIPALLYADEGTNDNLVVFGFTYALLDKLQPGVTVSDQIFRSIEEQGKPSIQTVDGGSVAVWREADDILFAVIPESISNPSRLF